MVHYKIPKTLKKILTALATGIAVSLALVVLSQRNEFANRYFTQFEHMLYDLSFRFKYVITLENLTGKTIGGAQVNEVGENRIVIVDIDERALERLGSYNQWPRTYHADVVRYLHRGGASAITFDILFKNADFGERASNDILKVMEDIHPELDWEKQRNQIRSRFNHDSILVETVRQADFVVVCATTADAKNYTHRSQWEPMSTNVWQRRLSPESSLSPEYFPLGSVKKWDLMDNIFPELAQAANRMALVNVVPDEDGIHRKVPLFHGFPNPETTPDAQTRIYPVIALQTVAMLFGLPPDSIKIVAGSHVDLGKPLGIWKGYDGLLRTTYPHLTWPMMRQILRLRPQIEALDDTGSVQRVIDVSSQVIVEKDENNDLRAEILMAQELENIVLQILLSDDWENISSKTRREEQVELASPWFLSWDETKKAYMLSEEDYPEDAIEISPYTIEVLRESRNLINSMKVGERRFLSSNMQIRYDTQRKRYSSDFIVIEGSVLRDFFTLDTTKLHTLESSEIVRLGDPIHIPVDAHNRMQINYTGLYNVRQTRRPFQQISYFDMVAGRVDPGSFQGKVFLLGSTAAALFDLVSAPHESIYPGVLIHATLMENILNRNFLQILGEPQQMAIILLLAILVALMAQFFPPIIALAGLLLMILGYFLTNFQFFEDGLYLGLARQGVTIVLSFVAIMSLRYFFEEREKRLLNSMFKSYISPELIDIMVESETRPALGGSESVCTAFFTDIAGFSTFTEAIDSPKKLVDLLNEYLGAMTDILTINRGTLDKYIGDAIVAIFGAPLPMQDHALHACSVGLLMQKKLGELRAKWKSEEDKWPTLVHNMQMRIGINTGPMVVGNMGSSMRMNYTMMGDTVNLAARLESGAKQYGVFTVCSDITLQMAGPKNLVYRELDKVKVMGKNEPVITHELLALAGDSNSDLDKLIELWQQAKNAYRATEWEKAIMLFEQCLELEPYHPKRCPGSKTTPSHVFIERCRLFQTHPPVPFGQEWDGVYVATSK